MIKSKVQSNTPTETPEEKAARESEQKRAEAAQIDETQGLLRLDTLRRSRRYGLLGGKNGFGRSGSGSLKAGSMASAASSAASASSYTPNVE